MEEGKDSVVSRDNMEAIVAVFGMWICCRDGGTGLFGECECMMVRVK